MTAKEIAGIDGSTEIKTLIETLHGAEQRLAELTAGEVDAVVSRQGRTMLLRLAQIQLRDSDAVKQAAILDALPAHVALLDGQGRIVSVNQQWRRSYGSNAVVGVGCAVGSNYPEESRQLRVLNHQRRAESQPVFVRYWTGNSRASP